MSLRVWLPLTKDLRNQGLDNVTVTNNGATFNSAGKLGGCYSFDGSDDYISITGSDLYSTFTGGSQSFSMAFWIYHADATRAIIFGDYGLSGTINFNIELSAAHQIRFYWNASPDKMFSTASAIPLATWTHIVLTYDGSKILLYKNGILQSENYSGTLAEKTKTSGAFYLGRDSRTGTTTLNGMMNDFRVYDHCLSPMEVKEISKGLILHYPLNRQGWGQENLATCTTPQYNIAASASSNYNYFWINSSTLEPNTTYTFSAEVEVSDGITECTIYNYTSSGNSGSITSTFPADGKRHSWTFTTTTTGLGLIGYAGKSGATAGHSAIYRNIKVEKGSVATPYVPKTNETLYTTMGLNSMIEYDCSGFCNNATKNNITYSSDTPRYNVSSVLNGSDSYIKVDNNNWMVKGMTEMTLNLWAKATTWPTNGRLISCTESGGFNLEAGNSGYWRFPVYVYTNSERTTSAYKYDSNEIKIADLIPNEWNMITLVYDGTGTRTYINGELHHTYTNVSYGINYNTNARLFLGCEANAASPVAPYFGGKESDLRIYATALSDDDIRFLYQNRG